MVEFIGFAHRDTRPGQLETTANTTVACSFRLPFGCLLIFFFSIHPVFSLSLSLTLHCLLRSGQPLAGRRKCESRACTNCTYLLCNVAGLRTEAVSPIKIVANASSWNGRSGVRRQPERSLGYASKNVRAQFHVSSGKPEAFRWLGRESIGFL